MEEEEGIDMGGVNVTSACHRMTIPRVLVLTLFCFADAFGGVEKVWLALIWRFILKYDLDGDDGEQQHFRATVSVAVVCACKKEIE